MLQIVVSPVNNSEGMDMGQSDQQVFHVKLQLNEVHRLNDVGKFRGLDVGHCKDNVAKAAMDEEKREDVALATGHAEAVDLHQNSFWNKICKVVKP